jgi:hypothetical protein
MVNHTEPIPTEWFRVKKWIIERYAKTKEVWCNSPDGKTFIIKLSTFEYPNIPLFVQKALHKSGYLTEWRNYQIAHAYTRLLNALNRYRKFKEQKQDVPQDTEFSVIVPLYLPMLQFKPDIPIIPFF